MTTQYIYEGRNDSDSDLTVTINNANGSKYVLTTWTADSASDTVTIPRGGTGATTATVARQNLGITDGSDELNLTLKDNSVTNAKIADDAVGIAELSATGTANNTTYLRGDNTWQTIASGYSVPTGVTAGNIGLQYSNEGVSGTQTNTYTTAGTSTTYRALVTGTIRLNFSLSGDGSGGQVKVRFRKNGAQVVERTGGQTYNWDVDVTAGDTLDWQVRHTSIIGGFGRLNWIGCGAATQASRLVGNAARTV